MREIKRRQMNILNDATDIKNEKYKEFVTSTAKCPHKQRKLTHSSARRTQKGNQASAPYREKNAKAKLSGFILLRNTST